MFNDYYQACEDAIRCQAQNNAMGVLAYLMKAAKLRDELLLKARTRLEFHTISTIKDYWEATLASLPYAAQSKRAALLLEDDTSQQL